ncbi:hypothetical protein MHYP_G00017160 [Metynnis hypsauchen]
MNSAVVLFLKTVDLADGPVQSGVVIDGQLTPVLPLRTPSKKVILSNAPPARELSRHGKLVSPIRKIPLGCKKPLIKHLVSFRRAVFMVLKDGEDLDLADGNTDAPVRAELERLGPAAAAGPVVVVSPAAAAHPAVADPLANPEPEGGEPSVVESAAEDTEGAERAMEGSSSSAPAVEEPGSTEGGTAITEGQTAEVSGCTDPVSAEVEMLDIVAEVDMVDEPVFKVPAKRKERGRGKGNIQPKKELSGAEADTDSEGSLSDSGWSVCSQEEGLPVRYTAEEIKEFLSATKGYRGVQVEKHFTDPQQFIHDVKHFRREGSFNALETFRLKKMLTKLHKAGTNEEDVS